MLQMVTQEAQTKLLGLRTSCKRLALLAKRQSCAVTFHAITMQGKKELVLSWIFCQLSNPPPPPPSLYRVHDFYCVWFLDLLVKYEDVIVLVLSGHTHQDSWVNVGPFTQFVTPSITPFSFKNPSFRVFVTNELYELVRIDTYYLDLGAANAKGRADWQLEYSLPQAYNMPDLSPASFDSIAQELLTNSTLWDLWNVYHRCSSPGPPPCNLQSCKVAEYCTLTSPLSTEWNSCMTSHSL